MVDYRELCAELGALIDGVEHTVANLANASALIFDRMDNLNWAGFYLYDGEKLVLNAFQGKPACIEIPMGRGVCGTAVAEGKTQLVPNVHDFPGHIACDSASNSEIVVPLFDRFGEVVGVLDIDSPLLSRFDENDRQGLEAMARIIEEAVFQ